LVIIRAVTVFINDKYDVIIMLIDTLRISVIYNGMPYVRAHAVLMHLYTLIYLLTAIGLPPGGSSTIHIYTQTIHRMTQNKQYIEQHKNFALVFFQQSTCNMACGIIINLVTLFNVIFALSKQKNNQVTRSQIMNFYTLFYSCFLTPSGTFCCRENGLKSYILLKE
jgi:hypothetical protein